MNIPPNGNESTGTSGGVFDSDNCQNEWEASTNIEAETITSLCGLHHPNYMSDGDNESKEGRGTHQDADVTDRVRASRSGHCATLSDGITGKNSLLPRPGARRPRGDADGRGNASGCGGRGDASGRGGCGVTDRVRASRNGHCATLSDGVTGSPDGIVTGTPIDHNHPILTDDPLDGNQPDDANEDADNDGDGYDNTNTDKLTGMTDMPNLTVWNAMGQDGPLDGNQPNDANEDADNDGDGYDNTNTDELTDMTDMPNLTVRNAMGRDGPLDGNQPDDANEDADDDGDGYENTNTNELMDMTDMPNLTVWNAMGRDGDNGFQFFKDFDTTRVTCRPITAPFKEIGQFCKSYILLMYCILIHYSKF